MKHAYLIGCLSILFACKTEITGQGGFGGEGGNGPTTKAAGPTTKAAGPTTGQNSSAQNSVGSGQTTNGATTNAATSNVASVNASSQEASVQASTNAVASTAAQVVSVAATASTGMQRCEQFSDCTECQQCAANGPCAMEADQCGSECIAVNDCLNACPSDNPATPADEFFACACGTDSMMSCDALNAASGSCFGDNPGGVAPLLAFIDCLFGPDGVSGPCSDACPVVNPSAD